MVIVFSIHGTLASQAIHDASVLSMCWCRSAHTLLLSPKGAKTGPGVAHVKSWHSRCRIHLNIWSYRGLSEWEPLVQQDVCPYRGKRCVRAHQRSMDCAPALESRTDYARGFRRRSNIQRVTPSCFAANVLFPPERANTSSMIRSSRSARVCAPT